MQEGLHDVNATVTCRRAGGPLTSLATDVARVGSAAMSVARDAVGDELVYEVDSGVARLTLNRPAQRNAMTWEMVEAMRECLVEARADPGVGAVVLQGAGERAFCSGADLGGMAGGDPDALHAARGQLAALFEDLWALGKPTIAAVHGYALAGGMGLALSCDVVIAADNAVFGTPEIDVGLWPFMITVPLIRSMPPKRALELMMTGRRVNAAEAFSLGFVTEVVPAADLEASVARWATALASKPPEAMRIGRTSFYETLDLAAGDALARLHSLLGVVADGEEAAEGIAAFSEKRPPRWRRTTEG